MFSTEQIQNFLSIIQNSHHARIISHRNPDADSIGSMIVFSKICEYYNLSYDIFTIDPIPNNLLFITENIPITYYDIENPDDLQNEQTDLVVFLDCGQINRVGYLSEVILPHQKIINIDHHSSNPLFGDFNTVMDISSTCELLYHLLIKLNIPLSDYIAQVLYIGILTDSGLFQYDKVNSLTHTVIADLMSFDIKHVDIYQNIYQKNPSDWLNLLKIGMENIELYNDKQVAVISFQLNDFNFCDFDDTHLFFPIVMSCESIKVCVILKEKEDGTISGSLRSKHPINIATIAQVFGGGGHIYAAGCRTSEYSINEFKQLILKEINNYLY